MATIVWGCDCRMRVSERAFDDYQTQEEHKKLMQTYKLAGITRFHYTNSGTLEYTQIKWFVSYYTFIVGYTTNVGTVHMHVNPFVFLKDDYRDSSTTNKQTNRWLRENGFEFTVQDLEHVYKNAVNGLASYPLTRVVNNITTYVLPRFNHYQAYLNDSWPYSHQKAIDKVPYLAYDEHQNSLVRVGWFIDNGKKLEVKYE